MTERLSIGYLRRELNRLDPEWTDFPVFHRVQGHDLDHICFVDDEDKPASGDYNVGGYRATFWSGRWYQIAEPAWQLR